MDVIIRPVPTWGRRGWLRIGLCVWLVALTAVSAHAAEWKRLDSPHFVTYAHLREDKARDVVMQLELMRWLTLKLLGVSEPASTGPAVVPEVLLTDKSVDGEEHDDSSFLIRSEYWYTSDADCLGVSGIVSSTGHGPHAARTGVFEIQAAQQMYAWRLMLLHAPMSFPQRWYAQGFARYLATTTYHDGALVFGAPHADATLTLSADDWLPYETVLRLAPGAALPSAERSMFDAQSWLLVYHLLETPNGKRQLADYLERTARGEPSVSAFEAATGRSIDAWAVELKTRVSERRFNARAVRRDMLPAVEVRASPVDPESSQYIELRRNLLCDGEDKQRGEALRSALKRRLGKPESVSPQLGLMLARADLLAGDTAGALARLEVLIRMVPSLADARLLFGRALRLRGDAAAGEERRAAYLHASEQLREAQRLSPRLRGVADQLAHVLAALGQEREALAAVREARRVDPAQWNTIRLEAELALKTGDRQGAAQALETLAFQAIWPAVAVRSNEVIAAIQADKPIDTVLKLLGLPMPQMSR